MIRLRNVERGLEVTEATVEAFQKQLTDFERKRDVNKNLDDGWVGDVPESEWCDAVLAAITVKVGKIKSYKTAQSHDILIYSNHPADFVRGIDGGHPEYQRLKILARQAALNWKSEPRLGVISVIDGRTLLYNLTGQCAPWKVVDMRPAASLKG